MSFEDMLWLNLLASGLRLSTPLLFAALGGLVSERSGIAMIALEGFLLAGAFAAASATAVMGSPWMGLLSAVVVGGSLGAFFALFVVRAKVDHIVAGTAFNLLMMGLIPLLSKTWFDAPGSTPPLPLAQRFSTGGFMVGAFLLAILFQVILMRTRSGLRLRATGESASVVRSLGVSPERVRWIAVILAGMITAVGGAFLSIAHASQYTRNMSSGRGFIALAALILAGWRPLLAMGTCLLFGIADAAQIYLQSAEWIGGAKVPVQFIQMFPYLVTLLALVIIGGRSRAPRDLGQPEVG